jgi:hypothetical protein
MERDNEETYIPNFTRDEGDYARCRVRRENGSEYLGTVRFEPFKVYDNRYYCVAVAIRNGATRDPFLQTVQGKFSQQNYAITIRYK